MKRRTFLGSLVALPAALKAGMVAKDPAESWGKVTCKGTAIIYREPLFGEIVEHEKDGLKGLYFNVGNGRIERYSIDEDGSHHTERI